MSSLILGTATAGLIGLGGATLHYLSRVRGPFEPTHYVWSRGLALMCDKNGGVDYVKRQRGGRLRPFDPTAYAHVRDGDLVWVRQAALPQFVAEVLPAVRNPFGLVTGDEDWPIPSWFEHSDRILTNPLVLHWFTQNFDGTETNGRVSGIPIGLDFHTLSNRHKWGHWPNTPARQDVRLRTLAARVMPTRQRALRVHADFHFKKHARKHMDQSRHDVEAVLRRNPLIAFQERKLRRIDHWRFKARFAFVVSPPGSGLDCHRTWESLALGNIVILRKSSLDPLFEGLPVVLVDDWDEITPDNLERWIECYAGLFSCPEVQERLTIRYWVEHMRQKLRQA